MIEYRFAENDDINSLKELWFTVFQEKKEAVDLFFEKIFAPEITYVATQGDSLISMLYLLPCSINGHSACYLYGAATCVECRGQGIMANLIDFALNNCGAEICVLLPASESLYNYYEKFGFKSLFVGYKQLDRKELNAISKPYQLQELFVSGYCGIRNRVLKKDFLFWNNKHIDFSFKYNELYGAKIIKSNYGYAVAYEDNGVCKVSEIICDKQNFPYLCTDLLSEFSCEKFIFQLSLEQNFVQSQKMKFGMVKYLADYKAQNIYCGLTLD